MDNEFFEEPEYPFFYRLGKCITLFANLSLALLAALVVIRLFELAYIGNTKQVPEDILTVILWALAFDLIFFVKLLPFVFVPFLIIFSIARRKRSNYYAFCTIGLLLIVVYLSLIQYFSVALVPLGADLYGYSMDEIRQTAGAGLKIHILTFLPFIVIAILFLLLTALFYKKPLLDPIPAGAVLGIGLALVFFDVSAVPGLKKFNSEFSYNLAVNKEAFFMEKTYAYFTDNEPEVDIYAINYIDDLQADSLSGMRRFTYISDEYPFLHKEETPDVLGSFFTIDSAKVPNIVIIQVEGLGRAYSGPNAYLGSFTPFLDQLASKSLYFENFLAAQGRTFASLPSILGSLPFADKGFSDLGNRMPDHLSLIRILRKNDYHSRFYSGFDNSFDNQDIFLKKQGIDLLIGEGDYDRSYVKSPANSGGFTWGYPDMELMRKSINMEASNSRQPYLTYIQTVSMHTPYTIPGQQEYFKRFEQHLSKMQLDENTKEIYRQYRNIYATILYADASLRYFFEEYAKLPSYSNTIFIITGDHRLPEIPMSTKIDRYHVPLIIYSPLLKRTASFRSISSHLDITPSLLAFLKKNYKLKVPDNSAWVGSGLDTARVLRNIHQYPLKQTKNDLITYISGLSFIDQDVLFTVGDNLNIEPVEDVGMLSAIRSEFNEYKAKNKRMLESGKLIPDSLYKQFR